MSSTKSKICLATFTVICGVVLLVGLLGHIYFPTIMRGKVAEGKRVLAAVKDFMARKKCNVGTCNPAVTPSKAPKTPKEPKEPVTTDKEPKRRKRELQDQSHRASKRTSSESSSTGSAPMKRNKAAATEKAPSVAAATPNNNAAGLNSVSNATSSSKSSSNLLRQSYVTRPVTPPLDVERISDVLRSKHVSPSNLKFGFLGLGNMGQGMVKNLINSGHHITVWNRTPSKCRDFVKAGAYKGLTPADVVAASDITFCCVSNSHAAKEMVFGNCGVLHEIKDNKGYVEMTSIDPDTSQDISEAIMLRGGRYLEAPVSGSKKPAEDGTLIILAAGDRSLFNDCASCFEAIGRHAFYLGEVGNGSKMSLILNMLLGTTLAGLAEAMALCDRAELSQKDLLEILELGDLNSAVISQKGQAIIEGTFATNMPLQHLQKDLCLAIGIGDQLEQPLPVTAAANEVRVDGINIHSYIPVGSNVITGVIYDVDAAIPSSDLYGLVKPAREAIIAKVARNQARAASGSSSNSVPEPPCLLLKEATTGEKASYKD
ncbi:LOW QUALITY PROTEIN: putative oxidoreductase GLYR1 homolog [Rhipicephalus sanguineus]|uniref:LOW QUALITY PROTEIN: putative oxidoreductase GLYR1 homolog n=1 Tax=Rhipicephalus sanguineus TaxID=34632 RepID=UPI0020C56D44|nr:LOW QUALITY PROTEIN: putative oxidoreductase GLYR1 homolog [Rhipicephalus sanguineus]